jgi:hypothetical protein
VFFREVIETRSIQSETLTLVMVCSCVRPRIHGVWRRPAVSVCMTNLTTLANRSRHGLDGAKQSLMPTGRLSDRAARSRQHGRAVDGQSLRPGPLAQHCKARTPVYVGVL